MLVKIIGGHGSVLPGYKSTSFLIDGKLLIDAGSVASGTGIDQQLAIEHILISHCHLDHICDLAFIVDNCCNLKKFPFTVHTSAEAKNGIMKHLFNDVIWPNFTKLPNQNNPIIQFKVVKSFEMISLGDYQVTFIPVNHPSGGHGFIIEKEDMSVVFTQDTGTTDAIWIEAKKLSNLKAIFTEISFPDHLDDLAKISFHHTPKALAQEVLKMPKEVPIYLTHIKPNYQDQIIDEVKALKMPRLHLLDQDNVDIIL